MSAPLAVPAGVVAARRVTDAVDRALVAGVARLAPDARAALDELAGAVAGTPLGATTADAVAALARGELLAHHLGSIAAARAAIDGAACDALLEAMAAATGLVIEEPEVAPTPAPEAASTRAMESARDWLVEIALAGFGQLESAAVVPAIPALRNLQEHPPLARLAALLTGFTHELADHAPTSAMNEVPARRWADLWSRALLSTFALPAVATRREVAGKLTPLGLDLRHHDHLLSGIVHALLEEREGGARRVVRVTLSAWRVDAVTGPEVFSALSPLAPELVDALVEPRALSIAGATLLSSGDLLWNGSVEATAADPFALDLSGARVAAPLPRDRHPMMLALPVVSAAGPPSLAPIDASRVSPYVELDVTGIDKATGFAGLLRYDDAFSIQPLVYGVKKKLKGAAEAIPKAAKVKERALTVLRERASRLLRKS